MTTSEKVKAIRRMCEFVDYPTKSIRGRISEQVALQLSRDWGWLMSSVVEKINTHPFDNYSVQITKYSVYVAFLDSDGVEHGKASAVFGTFGGTETRRALISAIDSFLENNAKYLIK